MDATEWDVDPDQIRRVPSRGHVLDRETLLVPVSELMRREPLTVAPEMTVAEAVRAMALQRCGCVLVTRGRQLLGIFSERDVMTRIVAPGLAPGESFVADHMTAHPETLRPHDEVAYALNIMSIGGFRHVPVVESGGDLVGIVSVRDIVAMLVDNFREEILTLPPRPPRHAPSSRHGG